jgi:hypothetical protein
LERASQLYNPLAHELLGWVGSPHEWDYNRVERMINQRKSVPDVFVEWFGFGVCNKGGGRGVKVTILVLIAQRLIIGLKRSRKSGFAIFFLN